MNLLDIDHLLEHDLVPIGPPATVATRPRAWAIEGSFNTFFGELDFGNIAEADPLRSTRHCGTEAIPRRREFAPFERRHRKGIPE